MNISKEIYYFVIITSTCMACCGCSQKDHTAYSEQLLDNRGCNEHKDDIETLYDIYDSGVDIWIRDGQVDVLLREVDKSTIVRMNEEGVLYTSISCVAIAVDLDEKTALNTESMLLLCPNITKFMLYGDAANGLLSSNCENYLENMTNIEVLCLSLANCSERELAKAMNGLQRLQSLELSCETIEGEAINWNFPELEYADLRGTSISDNAVSEICNQCPNIQRLYLDSTCISSDSLCYIVQLEQIEILSLNNTNISGGLHHLNSLSNLSYLYLQNTKVDDDSIKELRDARQLKQIQLSNTEITNDGVEGLANIPTLGSLMLYNTNIDEGVYESFKRMPNLVSLYLSSSCGMSRSDMQELYDQGVLIIDIDPNAYVNQSEE
jgi:hypothetical protein